MQETRSSSGELSKEQYWTSGRRCHCECEKGGKAPQYRKFHCAHCKDNSKWCSTNRCESLRKLDFKTRKQMLDANLDCEKCAGDCPKGACKWKLERICGQGVKGRGCGVQHVGSELFCPTAKCFMTATSLNVRTGSSESETDHNPWGRCKHQCLH